jgi:hypothetical protein
MHNEAAMIGEICHPDGRRDAARTDMALEVPQDGIVASRHSQAHQQLLADSASGGMAKKPHELGDAGCTAGKRSGSQELLDKCFPRTSLVATSPAPHPQCQCHWRALDRKVLQLTEMPAVS